MVWSKLFAVECKEEQMHLLSHSYFEGEADEKRTFPTTISEDELWNRLRFSPEKLTRW